MNIETAYLDFLKNLEGHGYGELDFIKFVRNYYFPRTKTQTESTDTHIRSNTQRDYSRYLFNGEKNLNKRKLVHRIVSYLLIKKGVTVASLNLFSKINRLTPPTRPLVEKISEVPSNYLNRYFSEAKDLVKVDKNQYAIYNQFGGKLFDELCEKFADEYNLKIQKQL